MTMTIKLIDLSTHLPVMDLEDCEFFRYRKQWRDRGEFELSTALNTTTGSRLAELGVLDANGAFALLVYRSNVVDFCGLILQTRMLNYQTRTVQLAGPSLAGIFSSRLIVPNSGQDYVSITGNAEAVLKALVALACITPNVSGITGFDTGRVIPGLTCVASSGRGGTVEYQGNFTRLLDSLVEVAQAGNLGFFATLVFSSGITFDVSVGTDRSGIVLGVDRGNLEQFNFTRDNANYISHVLAAGAGDQSNRLLTMTAIAAPPSGILRREAFADSRDLTTAAQLASRGAAYLADLGQEQTVNINLLDAQVSRYGVDFAVGDTVTVADLDFDISSALRIYEAEVRLDRQSGEKVSLMLGRPIQRFDNFIQRIVVPSTSRTIGVKDLDDIPDGDESVRLTQAARDAYFRSMPSNGTNLLPNAGFEQDADFWRGSGGGTSVVLTDASKAHYGNKYMLITRVTSATGIEAADDAGNLRYYFVNPAENYSCSCFYYLEVAGSVTLYLDWLDKDKSLVSTETLVGSVLTTWTWLYMPSKTVPAAAQYVKISIYVAGVGAIARVDDVRFMRIRDLDTEINDGVSNVKLRKTARDQYFAGMPAHGTNLCANGGFESGINFWDMNYGSSIITDAAKAHSGNKYCQLASAISVGSMNFFADENGLARYFETLPGDKLTISAYFYLETASSYGYVCIVWYDKDKAIMTGTNAYTTTVGSWVQVSLSATIPASACYARLYIYAINAASAHTTRVDDVIMTFVENTAYARPTPNERTGGGRGYSALNSGFLLTSGTTNRTVGNLESAVDTAGRAMNLNLASVNNGNQDDIPDGSTYRLVSTNQRDGGGRGYSALNTSNKLTTGTTNRTVSNIEAVVTTGGIVHYDAMGAASLGQRAAKGSRVVFTKSTSFTSEIHAGYCKNNTAGSLSFRIYYSTNQYATIQVMLGGAQQGSDISPDTNSEIDVSVGGGVTSAVGIKIKSSGSSSEAIAFISCFGYGVHVATA